MAGGFFKFAPLCDPWLVDDSYDIISTAPLAGENTETCTKKSHSELGSVILLPARDCGIFLIIVDDDVKTSLSVCLLRERTIIPARPRPLADGQCGFWVARFRPTTVRPPLFCKTSSRLVRFFLFFFSPRECIDLRVYLLIF